VIAHGFNEGYTGVPDAGATATVTGAGGIRITDGAVTFKYYLASDTKLANQLNGPPTNAGSYLVVASFSGDAKYTSAQSAAAPFTIGKATPKVVAIAPSSPGTGATAMVTGIGGAKITDGTVTFKYYLATDIKCAKPLSGPPTSPGSYLVIAYFSGDANYTSAQSTPAAFTIGKGTPTVIAHGCNESYIATPDTGATATVTGTGGAKITDGAVTYKYYLATDTKCANSLSGPPTNAGSYLVVASFSGDASYGSAQSAPAPFTISKATPKVLAIAPSSSKAGATAAVTGIGGVKITDGTVTFKYYLASDTRWPRPLSGPPTTAGSYLVIAYFSGDANYLLSQSAPTPYTIGK
jgi:hypothetical protein